MPRPKRTKVASTTATKRVTKPQKAAKPTPEPREASESSGPLDKFSDEEDGTVFKSSRIRRRWNPDRPEPQVGVDFTMSGALPAGDVVAPSESRQTPSSSTSKRTRASTGRKDSRAQKATVRGQESTNTALHDTLVDEESSITFGDLSFGSLDSQSPAHGTRPPSMIGGTPAHETSFLALTNFKRRTRQPSLLRMVHQTTDVEDNDLDELDDFNPEAESTPLNLCKNEKEQENEANVDLSLSSTSSRGRKRKLSSPVVQVPRSSPPFEPPSGVDVEESRSSSPSLPENIVPSREEVPDSQLPPESEPPSETQAPPRSSSTPVEDVEDSPVKPRQRGRRKATHSAAANLKGEANKSANGRTKAQSISTAKLQSMLPRRRTYRTEERDAFDIASSDEADPTPIDSDEDELQMPTRRTSAKRKGPKAEVAKKTSRKAKKPAMLAAAVRKNTKTYGRLSSDKENAGGEDESRDVENTTELSVTAPKSALAAIAKKFEDVDAFEMEFESVDASGENSSPWR
ncbi:hypothetical protein P154DRAFT_445556 [Amniculicola lignicola CBS 123094]|uniref:Uncharacterized protein n=1 Tax=Amniculicola lignicola CBS 123094 TaxID=1392246 RepID=A0A6A5W8G5_9PLEO|nr:hypothetical protein P154DRAFT_445556 [Amniculicola lignicola CBS 123094]